MTDNVSITPTAPSDDELLAALVLVLREDEPVPPDAVRAAIDAFTWQAIDAELLELLYDSAVEPLAPIRDAQTPSRLLTFTSPSVEVEIELTSDAAPRVRGVVTPAGHYGVELQQESGRVTGASSEAGMFELTAVDMRPLRLIITMDATGARVVTPWIDLSER
jgi:hypothetical protein